MRRSTGDGARILATGLMLLGGLVLVTGGQLWIAIVLVAGGFAMQTRAESLTKSWWQHRH